MTRADLYNRFAQALSNKIAARSMGLNGDADRLVDIAPADYVLTGFLTPLPRESSRGKQVDSQALDSDMSGGGSTPGQDLIDDVASENAFEIPTIGLEWLVPRQAFADPSCLVEFSVDASVYVRIIPTQAEQLHVGAWLGDRVQSTSSWHTRGSR
jgi:hypothetical protein